MKENIPLIDQTYDVVLPSGRRSKVKRFAMNLAMACGGETHVQLEDTRWIKAKFLEIVLQHS